MIFKTIFFTNGFTILYPTIRIDFSSSKESKDMQYLQHTLSLRPCSTKLRKNSELTYWRNGNVTTFRHGLQEAEGARWDRCTAISGILLLMEETVIVHCKIERDDVKWIRMNSERNAEKKQFSRGTVLPCSLTLFIKILSSSDSCSLRICSGSTSFVESVSVIFWRTRNDRDWTGPESGCTTGTGPRCGALPVINEIQINSVVCVISYQREFYVGSRNCDHPTF